MSQWVGDVAIVTKESCDQQLRTSIQDPGGGKNMDISPQKLNLATHHRIIAKRICRDKALRGFLNGSFVRFASAVAPFYHIILLCVLYYILLLTVKSDYSDPLSTVTPCLQWPHLQWPPCLQWPPVYSDLSSSYLNLSRVTTCLT